MAALVSKSLLVLAGAFFVACAAPSVPVPEAFTPCTVPDVGAPDSMGREVRASGFTFCVPQDWKPSSRGSGNVDAKRWGAEEGFLAWDTVITAGYRVVHGTIAVTGTLAPPPPVPVEQMSSPPCVALATLALSFEKASVLITQRRCERIWITTAVGASPALYVNGEAHSAEAAQVQLAIMKTIRFPRH